MTRAVGVSQSNTAAKVRWSGGGGAVSLAVPAGDGAAAAAPRATLRFTVATASLDPSDSLPALTVAAITLLAMLWFAILGGIRWSRKQFSVRLLLLSGALMLGTAVISFANSWPGLLAGFSTAQPLPLQLGGLVALGLVGIVLVAIMTGLVVGALPSRLASAERLPDRTAIRLGIAIGAVAIVVTGLSSRLLVPAWSRTPSVGEAGNFFPWLDMLIEPITNLPTTTAIVLTLLWLVDCVTAGWTRRRALGAAMFLGAGFAAAPPPMDARILGWVAMVIVMAAALTAAYALVLRADPMAVVAAIGTAGTLQLLSRTVDRTFAGETAGAIGGAVVTVLMTWWWWTVLRRAQLHVAPVELPVREGDSDGAGHQ